MSELEYWNRRLVQTARIALYSGIVSGFVLGSIVTLVLRAALGE